jgi:hypothetical protein
MYRPQGLPPNSPAVLAAKGAGWSPSAGRWNVSRILVAFAFRAARAPSSASPAGFRRFQGQKNFDLG